MVAPAGRTPQNGPMAIEGGRGSGAGRKTSRTRDRRSLPILCAILLAGGGCVGLEGGEGPFETRNLHPTQLTAWIPGGRTAKVVEGTEVRGETAIASLWLLDGPGVDAIQLDGELIRTNLSLRRGLGPQLDFRANLPVLSFSGGFLDDLIVAWHRAFGMPQNLRDRLPRDRARALAGSSSALTGAADPAYTLGEGGIHLGDLGTSLTWFPGAGEGPFHWGLRGGLEFPTGSPSRGFGNGGLDASFGAVAGWEGRRLSFQVWWDKSFLHQPGAAKRAGIRYPDPWSLGASLQAGLFPGGVGLVQVQVEPSLLRGLREAHARPTQASLFVGGRFRVREGLSLEFLVGEDLVQDVGPDVQFHLGFRLRLGTEGSKRRIGR